MEISIMRKYTKGTITTAAFFILASVALAARFDMLVENANPPANQQDRQTNVRNHMNSLHDPRTFRQGDLVNKAWMGNPPQPLCVGWGAYEFLTNFSTIAWRENYYHQCQNGWHRIEPGTPLLVDLDRNGFHLGDRDVGVYFDLTDSGTPRLYQWVAPGAQDAFLVRDLNGNGIIDDGSELFGNGTEIGDYGVKAPNGYYALSQLDLLPELGGNRDGIEDDGDTAWGSLMLWTDANANGVTDTGELSTMQEHSILSLETGYKASGSRRDGAGNRIPYWSFVHLDVKKGPKKLKCESCTPPWYHIFLK